MIKKLEWHNTPTNPFALAGSTKADYVDDLCMFYISHYVPTWSRNIPEQFHLNLKKPTKFIPGVGFEPSKAKIFYKNPQFTGDRGNTLQDVKDFAQKEFEKIITSYIEVGKNEKI